MSKTSLSELLQLTLDQNTKLQTVKELKLASSPNIIKEDKSFDANYGFQLALTCPNLRKLDVSDNEISNKKFSKYVLSLDDGIGGCHLLSWLKITENKLTSIEFVTKLKELTVLNASHNQLSSVPIYLQTLPKLKALILSHNQISSIDVGALMSVTQLNTLVLSNNQLTCQSLIHNEQSVFLSLQSLKKLSLAHNKLTEFPLLVSVLPDLKEIRLNDNQIDEFVDHPTCTHLEYLDIGNNNISDWQSIKNIAKAFPNVSQFNIKGNPISLAAADADEKIVFRDTVMSFFPSLRILNGERFDERYLKRSAKRNAIQKQSRYKELKQKLQVIKNKGKDDRQSLDTSSQIQARVDDKVKQRKTKLSRKVRALKDENS